MQENTELIRLATVIRYSERARELREMMGLKDNEFIVQFQDTNTTVRTMEKTSEGWNEASRETKKLCPNEPDAIYYDKHVTPQLLATISDYFQIALPEQVVFQKLFCAPPELPSGVMVRTHLNGRGNFEVIFEFETKPNARTAEMLYKELAERVAFITEIITQEEDEKEHEEDIKEHREHESARKRREDAALEGLPKHLAEAIRIDRTERASSTIAEQHEYTKIAEPRSINMDVSLRERIGSPRPFDEKYDIALTYKTIQERLPTKERQKAMENLLEHARKVLGKVIFTADDLSSMVYDINESFEVRLIPRS